MENLTKESKPYLSGDYDDFFTASKTENLTEEEAVAYSQSYLKELDNQSVVRFATRKSREEGREEGILEGTLRVARNMLKRGMSILDVSRCTDLPESEILMIQNDLQNASIYYLFGQKVSKDAKGLLIQNGKKFIRK